MYVICTYIHTFTYTYTRYMRTYIRYTVYTYIHKLVLKQQEYSRPVAPKPAVAQVAHLAPP